MEVIHKVQNAGDELAPVHACRTFYKQVKYRKRRVREILGNYFPSIVFRRGKVYYSREILAGVGEIKEQLFQDWILPFINTSKISFSSPLG